MTFWPCPQPHLHSTEAFNLEPGFDLLWCGVVGDVSGGQSGAAWRSLELLLSTATEGEPVHQLVLDLIHVGLAAWRVKIKASFNLEKEQLSSLIHLKQLVLVNQENWT